jgi:glycosyltransferase involved in cell wall biosynthesis
LKIDVIIPVFNPIPHWEKNLFERFNHVCNLNPQVEFHLILVNDGSLFGCNQEHLSFLEENIANFSYIHHQINKGKGSAIRSGVASALSDYIIYTDVDFPYTMESFNNILNALVSNTTDIVVGVRPQNYYNEVPWFRIFLSKSLRLFNKYQLGLKVYDTQCGLF